MDCPNQYKEICGQFVTTYFERRYWQIRNNFALFLDLSETQIQVHKDWGQTPFGHQVCEIARAAAGQIEDDAEGFNRSVVYEGIQDLVEQLFAPPGLFNSYNIPREFWQHPLGGMVGLAWAWVRQDRLLRISEIAERYNLTTQAVSQAIKTGRITGYHDPEETNPQHATRVSEREAAQEWGDGV